MEENIVFITEIEGELANHASNVIQFALDEASSHASDCDVVLQEGKHLRVTVEVIDHLSAVDE